MGRALRASQRRQHRELRHSMVRARQRNMAARMSSDTQSRTTEISPVSRGPLAAVPAAELHVVHPRALAATIAVRDAQVVLGRRASDDGVPALLHGLVSRRHFAFEWDRRQRCHFGTDLGSQNGSWVDGRPVQTRIPIADGSVIRVGAVLAVYESAPAWDAGAEIISCEAIPGNSGAARRLRAEVARAARDPGAVLLCGPTGAGKEFVAQELHRASGRSGLLVAVNCAALAPELMESELFGHVRGAFSGAHSDHPGLFRAAQGGTLLLDEIGELPLLLQPKLLRALQDKRIRPVGATRDVAVDVRIVASTHRELAQMVESGEFRRDLRARLALWEIHVPALAQRRSDLFLWLERLHARWQRERGLPPSPLPDLDPRAAEALLLLDWPENLRGVQRLVHELGGSADARGAIGRAELPRWLFRDAAPRTAPASTPVVQASRPPVPSPEEFAAAYDRCRGSVRAMAQHFQRDRRQIYRWLTAHGLSRT